MFLGNKKIVQILIVQTRGRSFKICYFTRNWSGIARENFKHKAQSSLYPFITPYNHFDHQPNWC